MNTGMVTQGESTPPSPAVAGQQFQEKLGALVENISSTVVIPEETVRFVLLGLASQGHVLLEDTPGVGKTLLAKTLAQSIEGRFARIQCTPDLLPSDITGTSVFNINENHFEFKPGPVFSNILVADEINRTTPRTQAALLESMAEYQVSADGEMYPLPRPFMVIATQNQSESHGVFPLPDSQLDRFLIRMSLGTPNRLQELEILNRAEHGMSQVSPVISTQDVLAIQDKVREVNVSLPVKEFLVNIARATRDHAATSRGISPRGTVSLQRAAQGWAAFEGRDFLMPEDVKRVTPLVVTHRLMLRSSTGVSPSEIVQEVLDTVPIPV